MKMKDAISPSGSHAMKKTKIIIRRTALKNGPRGGNDRYSL